MTCPTENVLAAFLEGRLSADEIPKVVEHMDTCAECRALIADAAADPLDSSSKTHPNCSESGSATQVLQTEPTHSTTHLTDTPQTLPNLRGYRLVERIGCGAMGEVFRAEDEELGRPVAIKVLSATSTPEARRRFLNEARAVARLRHPNIVTIFSSAISDERPYIVSELLSGSSLDKLTLPLSDAEVLQVAKALAGGLAAAHRQGVLHRDIKPANAMRTDEGEIKLLDFGLAKFTDAPVEIATPPAFSGFALGASLTHTGAMVGTPLYLAPECWKGAPASMATDVYSLGALLYELGSGRPVHRATSLEELRRGADEHTVEPLQKVAPKFNSSLAAIIERCLSGDPSHRYPSAIELADELSRVDLSTLSPRKKARWPIWVASTLVALGTAAAAWFGVATTTHKPDTSAITFSTHPSNSRRAIAVIPFTTDSAPESAWLSVAFSELLATGFAAGEGFRVVSGDEVARIMTDLELRTRGELDAASLQRMFHHAAVHFVVTGAVKREGKALTVNAHLVDTSTGAVLASSAQQGDEANFLDLGFQVGAELIPALGQLPLSNAQTAKVRTVIPDNPVAARLYSEGIERFRLYDFEAGGDRFQRAAREAPESPMPHYRLASLWYSLGRDDDARREAKLAVDRSTILPREIQLQVKALHYQVEQSNSDATETLRMLHELYPDTLEYGLKLAAIQPRSEALETLAELRKLPPPIGDDPRIDLTEYRVAAIVPDGLVASTKAAEKARKLGARLLLGQALCSRGWALLDQGDLDAANGTLNEALTISDARGDVFTATEAMRALGVIAQARGDLTEALHQTERAETALAALGNYASYVYALRNVAGVYRDRGDMALARKKYEQSLQLAEYSGNKNRIAQAHWVFGAFEHVAGNIAAARVQFNQAVTIAKDLKDPWLERMFQGDLGRLLVTLGDLPAARESFNWAIRGKDEEGRHRSAAPNKRELALLELWEGQLPAALAQVSEALSEVEREKATTEIALAEGVKARVLAAMGDLPNAVATADRAFDRMSKSQNRLVAVRTIVAWAHVHAKEGNRTRLADVEKTLKKAAEESQRLGYGEMVQEAEFAQCEVWSVVRSSGVAKACFRAFETAARAGGYTLLADRAKRLAQ